MHCSRRSAVAAVPAEVDCIGSAAGNNHCLLERIDVATSAEFALVVPQRQSRKRLLGWIVAGFFRLCLPPLGRFQCKALVKQH